MLRLVSAICLLLAAVPVSGQKIRALASGFEEYTELLKQAGYEAYSFDIADLLDDKGRYDITIRIREYSGGVQTDSTDYSFGSNKLLVTDFPEDQRSGIAAEDMADAKNGIYARAVKLILGRYPSGTDSVSTWMVSLHDMRSWFPRLRLRNIGRDSTRPWYSYRSRPFELEDSIKSGEFIPLVFFGSMWYDTKYNAYCFCGDNEIATDLSSEIVSHVPHFYVMGMIATRTE